MNDLDLRRLLCALATLGIFLVGCASQPAAAQGKDPNAAFANELIVAQLPGRSITALITHPPGATKFTHAVAIFPGSPGYINLRIEDGAIQNDQRGGFLIRARRFFLESVVTPGSRGRGVEVTDIKQIRIPVLWVHHRNDPCEYTPHHRVRNYAQETKTPLVTVTGVGDRRGKPCMAFTEHGFVGMEAKTIKAILSWIRTGAVPADVSE